MPTQVNSIADKLNTWNTLVEGMKPRQEELAYLKEDHAELGGIVQEMEALITQTDQHEARLRESTSRRLNAETRGAELYGRLVAALRGRYGKRALLLHEFGIQPNALPGPPKKDEATPPAPTPAPASQEPTPDSGA
jgi:hypothetical protein